MNGGHRNRRRIDQAVGTRTTINPVPIYEFACESCGHRFEELVGSHVGPDVAEVECPECGSRKVERQLSTSYAPLQHQMTPNQRRRLEDKRRHEPGRRQGALQAAARSRGAERREHVSDAESRREALVEVYNQASVCERCPLSETRNRVVFGSGNADADLMFVGEAPGAEEDRQGLPFVGRAGGFLPSCSRGSG